MKELILKGTDAYIDYMSKHLPKEHPETKGKVKVRKIQENVLRKSDIALEDFDL